MKKNKILIFVFMLFTILFTACEEVPEKGIYKEGTYFGSSEYELSGIKFTTTATLYVNENGIIKSVFIDSTYLDGSSITTRKKLGNTFGLSNDSSNLISKESWDNQVGQFEKMFLKEQDLNFIKWKNEEKTLTDSIEGVTMPIKDIYVAVDEALTLAK